MKKRMTYSLLCLLLYGLAFGGCNTNPSTAVTSGFTKNDVLNVKSPQDDPLNVRIVKDNQQERDEILVSSFLRCVDVALSYVKLCPLRNNEYNFLDEAYFRSKEPVFLVHKKHTSVDYKYKKVREFDCVTGTGYDIYRLQPIYKSSYNEGFIPKTEFSAYNSDESHGRVSYEEVLRNFFTGEYYGKPYVPDIQDNRNATEYIYNIFLKLYHIDDFVNSEYNINPSFGFETIWKQHSNGSIYYLPLNEIRDAYSSYKETPPNVDLTKFADYLEKQSWDAKRPIMHYYLYIKSTEVDMDSQYKTMQ
ncbi:MAG: hypothetical protein LBJ39_01850 [Tannerellaceae bacterium]|jgi:hypothetical protein|nr:hypothetical protein [Tannerellaceae bacterium]